MSKEIIKNFFKNNKLFKYKFRENSPQEWDDFLDQLSYSPITYSSQELDYQKLYREEQGFLDKDLSLIISYSNKNVAITSFSLLVKNNQSILSSFGLPVLPPIFLDDTDKNLKENITKLIFSLLKEITFKFQIKQWKSCETLLLQKKSLWKDIAICNSDKFYMILEGYIDLEMSHEDMIHHLKKKKILIDIKKAKNLWNTKIKEEVDIKEWENFKDLHIKVSGRKTRSNKTWKSQFEDINKRRAFVIFLYDKKNQIIGGAMYRYTKNSAIYAIGVYDRDLFPKPISHLAHYLAINELKSKKIRWLKMGEIPREKDFNLPSKKEISIGLFKKKFSTNLIDKMIYIHS